MDINAIHNIRSEVIARDEAARTVNADSGFDTIFSSALNMLNETNNLQNTAESMEIQFALGDAVNTHDLQIAQQKANVALAYTVAVRDKVIDAYNSIMNMQI